MDIQKMMRQAQKMQSDMQVVQQQLEEAEVTASAGGGVVTVTVTGAKKIKAIKISPDVVDKDDVEMLEDLVTAAVSEAMDKADELAKAEMGKVTGGLGGGLGGLL
ncbi:MAG: YbaB/EbfC family nucleoid-associated protein [Eubacteriales bacterium]